MWTTSLFFVSHIINRVIIKFCFWWNITSFFLWVSSIDCFHHHVRAIVHWTLIWQPRGFQLSASGPPRKKARLEKKLRWGEKNFTPKNFLSWGKGLLGAIEFRLIFRSGTLTTVWGMNHPHPLPMSPLQEPPLPSGNLIL